mmetsp:Transcript_24740/g.41341  ORF Transcript_24740/g.41341 Transcript_24740/m.41341 type:complete len:694 (+) Transcript_24740:414-2495(+)|eukprot:CAMPEP_0198229098 /NCGR_PEP_ID=MMETSP1445-20131203/113946_1 /TAXON_ID=36898 /ORGANISM="Pyramimonas sp., Strain CCMP2087" /LENGTH=693 /DNA_ID=CAMNT_0043909541 /DNA_START=1301 /DNA_END=3382 /DNA_ORIENTATION=-
MLHKKAGGSTRRLAAVKGFEPPRALLCPITLGLMRNPVIDANGHTFDRSAIEISLVLRPGISPLTNARYPDDDASLTPDLIILGRIEAFLEDAGASVLINGTRTPRRKRNSLPDFCLRSASLPDLGSLSTSLPPLKVSFSLPGVKEEKEADREQAQHAKMMWRKATMTLQTQSKKEIDVAQMEQNGDHHGLVRLLEDSLVDGATKSNAVQALRNVVALGDAYRVAVVEAGALPPLMELLRSGSDEARANAAEVLGNLTFDDDDMETVDFVAAGAIPGLVEMLRGGSDEGRGKAAWVLRKLMASNHANKAAVTEASALPPLVELLRTGSKEGRANAAGALGILLSGNDTSSRVAVAKADAMPLLVELLRCGSNEGRAEAAGALSNLGCDDANKAAIVAAGGIAPLVELLGGGLEEGRAKAAAALANIASSDDAKKTAVVWVGALAPLVKVLRCGSEKGKEAAAWVLGNLSTGNQANKSAIVAAAALHPLVHLIQYGSSEEGKAKAAWVLGNLTAGNHDNKAAVAKAGAIPPLVQLLRRGSDEGKAKAAWALGSLAAGNDANRSAVAEAGAIPLLAELLRDRGSSAEGGSTRGRPSWHSVDPLASKHTQLPQLPNLVTTVVATVCPVRPPIRVLSYSQDIHLLGSFPPSCASPLAEGRRHAARALYNQTFHEAGRSQITGLGYTRDQLGAMSDAK